MNLESKMVQLEDSGRQLQIFGKREDINEMCRKIDEVTREQLIELSRRVLTGSEPTVLIQGDRDSFGDVKGALAKYGIGVGAVKQEPPKKKGWW
ncbi:unnamed protein product [Ambrosiozyma monospora]|uniref:Unnamed protein product n=1 Tax=Ambrosiozyma monospora TaxID=43982 RepID=A0ACB5T1R0_AMBMO|nr:unnamed protein product [Ambrosiozyma monospora]